MEDIIDLRDLADEWEELQEHAAEDAAEDGYTEDDRERQRALIYLCDELGVAASPQDLRWWANYYEPTLIAESYFEKYAQELAEEIGAIDPRATWPLDCIDWELAAHELAADYTVIRYDGTNYYLRSC